MTAEGVPQVQPTPQPQADPSTMNWPEMNAMMTARIRGTDPQPYIEGQHVLRVVEHRGRTTGQPRYVPIAVTQLDGHRYVCSPNRQRDWARNLLASAECTIERDAPSHYRAVLVNADEAVNVVSTYLGNIVRRSGTGGGNFWPFPKDASPEEIRRHTDVIAVFRLEPTASR
jgi:hypothetical protein